MVTETVIETAAPSEEANLAPEQEAQTETPPEGEGAVASAEEAVASKPDDLQVEVTAPKPPEYMTREEAERFWQERDDKVRADEREREQNRRRTEAAREAAKAATQQKRVARLHEQVSASFITETGVPPPEGAVQKVSDGAVELALEILRQEGTQSVEQVWDWLTAPVYGKEVELSEDARPIAETLGPKLQHLVNQIKPQIVEEARKGYIAESDLPRLKQTWAEEQAAKGREGQEEIRRVNGTPTPNIDRSIEAVTNRIISDDADDKDREIWNARFKKG